MTAGSAEEGLALYVLRAHGLAGAGAYGRVMVLEYLAGRAGPATYEQILDAYKERRLFKRKRVEREVEVLRRAGLVTVPMDRAAQITEQGREVLKQLKGGRDGK